MIVSIILVDADQRENGKTFLVGLGEKKYSVMSFLSLLLLVVLVVFPYLRIKNKSLMGNDGITMLVKGYLLLLSIDQLFSIIRNTNL